MTDTCPRCGGTLEGGDARVCPRCLLEADLPPALIGGTLELGDEIGQGGMGTVYRAVDRRLGRTVAVKFLPPALAARPDLRERFAREARALAHLTHPHIVTIHDFGEEGDEPYIVMEYVEGGPLSAHIPMSVERAARVMTEVCEAVAYAHDRGLVHRDLKPENILLDAAGRAKVSDFGIARMMQPDPAERALTAPGVTAGTLHYCAPEVIDGAPPDPRSDVYALGVVLYELVTGRLPLGDFDALPPSLDRIVRRALAPDPERRYPSAAAMGDDLARGRASESTSDAVERPWTYAVAAVASAATATALWALLVSVTPKVLARGDLMPLIMLGTEDLGDGRIVSRARFETWPALSALVATALAIAAYAWLRLHWRQSGAEGRDPHRRLREGRWVLAGGAVAIAVYGVRKLLEVAGHAPIAAYFPLAGGVLEVGVLFCVWVAVLEAWRTKRPLRHEPALWVGTALALVPPAVELVVYLVTWQPA